jgi:hypothetical protein
MDCKLAWAAFEDQPSIAGVGTRKLKDVTEERSSRLYVLGIDQRVHCSDHDVMVRRSAWFDVRVTNPLVINPLQLAREPLPGSFGLRLAYLATPGN